MSSQPPIPPPPPGYPQQQPYPQQAPYPYSAPQPGNGLAVASMVLGIIGTVIGLIPLLAIISFVLGLLAVIFGPLGIRRANRGASGKGMAVAA